MKKVTVKATFRVTTNKGKEPAQDVFEIEHTISQDDQKGFAANSCHCAPSANQGGEEKRKVTISLEC